MSIISFLSSKNTRLFLAGFITALTAVTLFKVITTHTTDNTLLESKRKRVLFFGDSITQHGFNVDIRGWVSQIGNWWTRRIDILNRGFSGYNSRWGKLIVDKVVIKENPDFLFVFFGANDAVDPSVLQHVPLPEYKENMEHIIQRVKQHLPSIPVILITPPPIWEGLLEHYNRLKGKPLLIDRTNARTKLYAEIVLSLGEKYKIPIVDIWNAMEGSSDSRAEYLSDGLHLSGKGCDKLFEESKRVILKHYPDWNPEVMKMQLLEWSQIDRTNPVIY